MTTAIRTAALLGIVAFAGCAADLASPASNAGQIKRTISCQEKPGVDPTTVLRLANDFSKVPGVLDVSAGRGQVSDMRVPTTLPQEAITFILTFRDAAAVRRADQDPTYRHVRDDLLPAVTTATGSTDVTLQNYLVSEQYTEETTTATRERRAAAVKQLDELRSRTK